ncbi:uncharacterized protein L203_103947 [Cryptococcus depauperatus CBS 7841]|uniref:Uncharacterized protein n=1 Tax=Cryptococcus depauperatus CBS 7841 TaxID=1295531 RepID=A0AAJ8JUL4_9TREE
MATREVKLASARKKLHSFRASRASADPQTMPLITEPSLNYSREENDHLTKARLDQKADSQAYSHGLHRKSVVNLLDTPDQATSSVEKQVAIRDEQVVERLSTFTFGSKPSSATFPPRKRQVPKHSSQTLFSHGIQSAASPPASPNRFSSFSSRPPSLVLTRPPSGSLESPPTAAERSTMPSPPLATRKKHHSHTRSNSISLPNLKLHNANSRPNSLGVSVSPSFGSPVSPVSTSDEPSFRSRLSGPFNSQKLKFEPSGRGAEAEKDREESRRRALEKLTGSRSKSPVLESSVTEISLPILDEDEDYSSVSSSSRPQSYTSSLILPPLSASLSPPSALSGSPLTWNSSDDLSPSDGTERWSGYSFGLQRELSAGRSEPLVFGMEFGAAMVKRPSINRQLSALQEVDESEEDDDDDDDDVENTQQNIFPALPPLPSVSPPIPTERFAKALEPAFSPTGLKQLKLSSMASPRLVDIPGSADSVKTFTFSNGASSNSTQASITTSHPSSPTKSYGTIGRGHPVDTTNTAKNLPVRRRTTPSSSGSRSSISYVKDDAVTTTSQHDLSINICNVSFQAPSQSLASPSSFTSSPTKADLRWVGNSQRTGSNRPCPRSKSIMGNIGAGRVLGEVDEVGEEGFDISERSRESMDQGHWRDVQLEMERERESLRDEVELWKGKYQVLKEKLETERKDSIVLRERVRKLGDRLSSISSIPTEKLSDTFVHSESRLINEMREQLFNLTARLEQERRAKESAINRLKDLREKTTVAANEEEPGDNCLSVSAVDSLSTANITPAATPPQIDQPIHITMSYPIHPDISPSLLEQSHASNEKNERRKTPDLAARFRGWGFPKELPLDSQGSQARDSRRESFFGLSNPLRRTFSDDGGTNGQKGLENGMDLPPFMVSESGAMGIETMPTQLAERRAVSDSGRISHSETLLEMGRGRDTLPFESTTISTTASNWENRSGIIGRSTRLDFRKGCKYCVGQVFEV